MSASSALDAFHPAVAAWFAQTFAAPTPAQCDAWPAIRAGRHTLVAAPTGSGKTLAAFLAAIDGLVREGVSSGLPEQTTVVYVSPLKALSNDIAINLEAPLAGIRDELARRGLGDLEIRTGVRTGDTPAAERQRMLKRPPQILVTTPESLYLLLGSESGRLMLAGTRSVIVDEIHAIADDKRGSHLALSLERLEALCQRRLIRIGLSATQKPIEEVARFLVGASHVDAHGVPDCAIVDSGHVRPRDLAIEMPPVPLEAVMSNEAWQTVYDRLATLVDAHRTTLVFVNTRRMAERAARHLGERLGKEHVAAHHGSLARELRLEAEQRLKRADLKVLVATASLELGIDIGDVDLVCQLGSPRSIAALLQRVGRSGHAVGATPKGRLFPQSRDDLVECVALLDCIRRGELDALKIPTAPLDVLAQQIVAEVACGEWDESALYDWLRRAWPYRELARADFDAVVRMLAEGYTTRHGARAGYVHRDAVHGKLRGRRNARLTALTSAGTIPDTADYAVVVEPAALTVGSVHEDFAIESMAGDIFQLGNTSYRVLRVERGQLRVEDAQGLPPSIPFWIAEAPGRSDELSLGVSRLRQAVEARLTGATQAMVSANADRAVVGGGFSRDASDPSTDDAKASRLKPLPTMDRDSIASACAWLVDTVGIDAVAAQQLVDYLARARNALGVLPTRRQIVLERFFDESGGTQLIVHSPFGSRINKAWGLALRKRFCRTFNFELQAAATEDAIVLSLSTSHSFPLIEVSRYLHSASAGDVLVQALLDAPLFGVRWRWAATTALALPRYAGGRRVAPQLQRMKSEDLLASVFPDQVACLENIVGERQIPDHPLVAQTLDDCLHEAMDAEGWLAVLRGLEDGSIGILARDLPEPSPLAAEILGARPYAFLDDAPLEERRTQAVQMRRWSDPESADDLGALDAAAIEAVREEAWPDPRDADEMHETLMGIGWVSAEEAASHPHWADWLNQLGHAKRATRLSVGSGFSRDASASDGIEASRLKPLPTPPGDGGGDGAIWVAAERLGQFMAIHPGASLQPAIAAPAEYAAIPWTQDDALVEVLRARLSALGPVTVGTLAGSLHVSPAQVEQAVLALEAEGTAMRGRFSPGSADEEWCERHLLSRIHRYTLKRLRREIEPVEARDFMRFLFDWHRLTPGMQARGADALPGVLAQLEGFECAAAAWEAEVLPARLADYAIHWLDEQCRSGRIVWARFASAHTASRERVASPLRSTPVVLLPRRALALWSRLAAATVREPARTSSRAGAVLDYLRRNGASFFDEIAHGAHLLKVELEEALGELVARGLVNADSFAGLRALLVPAARRNSRRGRSFRRASLLGIEDAGRWALSPAAAVAIEDSGEPARSGTAASPAGAIGADAETVEHVARTLLRRYGVVCWRLLAREAAWLPPWRELLRVFRRLEARGEIRGGRFIAGLSGEQFALAEAIPLLRKARARDRDGQGVVVAAADPLNLVGILGGGARVAAVARSRVLYVDGVPVAALVGGDCVRLDGAADPLPASWRQRLTSARQDENQLLQVDPG
ncbi:DEAD/DEAH box helicase [Dokdonella immobilis]|uniref:ATP dependent helicase, Lhr family n=1 Tax=Dokdonella immobilis TaxID=578942 RepID=A0A1I4X8H2_9GAMM|nr:DEAD/DEAH box helicase [Dokdonella immobilis]SFN21982.1 ATP dependent helicase, Lhr family [Dokdonella immobilis]